MNYQEKYQEYMQAVEQALPGYLPSDNCPQKSVVEAMKYSLLGAGKRLRAVLVLAFHEACGGRWQDALPMAAAVEMVHAYSLIHDDLPCMDDDDLRRGKPSCHIAFGEATALLAGDALQPLAVETILRHAENIPAERRMAAALALVQAAGAEGMVGGQTIDIEQEGKRIDAELLNELHRKKTGALIRASVRMGCVSAGAPEDVTEAADRYAAAMGLMFQIVDDILDETSTEAELGKPVRSDEHNCKTTYVTLYGLEGSREKVRKLAEEACSALAGTRLDCAFFRNMAEKMAVRTH